MPRPIPAVKCSNCRFSHQRQDLQLECRIHHPHHVDTDYEGHWPKTGNNDWCGEFQPLDMDAPRKGGGTL
jgi:hypothetical protein